VKIELKFEVDENSLSPDMRIEINLLKKMLEALNEAVNFREKESADGR